MVSSEQMLIMKSASILRLVEWLVIEQDSCKYVFQQVSTRYIELSKELCDPNILINDKYAYNATHLTVDQISGPFPLIIKEISWLLSIL